MAYTTEAGDGLRGKPAGGVEVNDPSPQGPHDPPPPDQVPSEIAVAAAKMTHSGRPSPSWAYAPVTSARKMTPMVFWASWSPCPSAIAAA